MALKTDFDRRAYFTVLWHALGGAVLGMLPGALMASTSGDRLVNNALGLTVLGTGGVVGALIGGTAAATGCLVAVLKSRGAGSGKVTRLKDYHAPEQLPPVPGATKPERSPAHVPSLDSTPTLPPPAKASQEPAPAPLAPQPVEFVDYDRPGQIS
jgi:hypothetical protein